MRKKYIHICLLEIWGICLHLFNGVKFLWYQMHPQIAQCMGPTWGPRGFCRPQVVPMLAPHTPDTVIHHIEQSWKDESMGDFLHLYHEKAHQLLSIAYIKIQQIKCLPLNTKIMDAIIATGISIMPTWHLRPCQEIGSELVRVLSCFLFSSKPLPQSMLTYCQLDLQR